MPPTRASRGEAAGRPAAPAGSRPARAAGSPRRAASGNGRIAGAAALIAALTVASRVAGFGRTAVFSWSVGPTDLGDIYLAANWIPNIIFEVVAGGALAGLVVPVLAGAVARRDGAAVAATASALLTWTLALLVPLAGLVVVAPGPVLGLVAGDAAPAQLAMGERLLRVFGPQLPLYGAGTVLAGVLQAHRRFTWPVLAPLLSSGTAIGTYLGFAALAGPDVPLEQVGPGAVLLLAAGTTLAVAVLSGCLLIPLRRLGLRLRPAVRLSAGLRRDALRLAGAGAVTVAAQQVAMLVFLRLALAGPGGTAVQYHLAQQVYLLPWAVLAVPVATVGFPVLAAARATADPGRYRDTLAGTARGVVLLSCLGAAVLVAVAEPAAGVLIGGTQVGPLAAAIAGFAPGLLGYGLFALLSRALYARGDSATVAGATVAGWAVAAASAAMLAAGLPGQRRALALAAGNSAGMLLLAAVLLGVVLRRVGPAGLRGTVRAGVVGVTAGVVAAVSGLGAGQLADTVTGGRPGAGAAALAGVLAAVTTGLVFLAGAYAGDRHDVRPLLAAAVPRPRREAVVSTAPGKESG